MIGTGQSLLLATRRCITTKGLARTTSRDIAAEAGANLAAITYHFGSKDQLVAEALLDVLRAWLGPTLEVLGGDGDPTARTLSAVQTLTETFEEHRDEAPAFLQALIEAPRMEPLRAGVVALWEELGTRLATQMTDMKQSGELAGWVDPATMSSLLIAVANGLVLQVIVDPDGPALTAMASQFATLLLAGRQAPGATRAGAKLR